MELFHFQTLMNEPGREHIHEVVLVDRGILQRLLLREV